MTFPVSAVAMFCSDVRDELQGALTVVGIMPDNIRLPEIPAAIPQLTILVRIHLAVASGLPDLRVIVRAPDGSIIIQKDVDRPMMEGACRAATLDGNPLFGVNFRLSAAPFPVNQSGRYAVFIVVNGEENEIGSSQMLTGDPPSQKNA
jgi:hypothetical protein